MKETFLNIKNTLFGKRRSSGAFDSDETAINRDNYVELDTDTVSERTGKLMVRQFVMEDFEDIKAILDSLRNGQTIALINIQPLKDKDIVELKRAINKLKKTCDAIQGDIAGFGEDYVVATPEIAGIYRQIQPSSNTEEPRSNDEEFE